jgi:hypothetical protein
MDNTNAIDYTRQLIYYAIVYHKGQLINLLKSKGIQVPENVDTRSLHFIVLKAMADSGSFKNDFQNLLASIALVNGNSYRNDDGTTTTTTPAEDTSIKGLLSQGLTIISQIVKQQGTPVINKEIGAPTQPTNGSATKSSASPYLIVGVVLGLGLLAYFGYKHFKK